MSRLSFLLLLLCTLLAPTGCQSLHFGTATSARTIRVACVGDSITFGAGIKNREQNSYPAQLQALLGSRYEVRNFGVSGRTLLKKGDFPYWSEKAYQQALQFNPDVVVIKLGTNDSKPQNWQYKNEFAGDYKALIASFKALPSHPRILVCLPVPAFKLMWGITPEVIANEQLPILREVASQTGSEVIDLYTPHLDKGSWFPDNIHPNATGAGSMAKIIAEAIRSKVAAK